MVRPASLKTSDVCSLLLLIFVAVIFSYLFLGCANKARVKLYKFSYKEKLFVREKRKLHKKDVKTLKQADGFICTSQRDLERAAEGVQSVSQTAEKKGKKKKWWPPF